MGSAGTAQQFNLDIAGSKRAASFVRFFNSGKFKLAKREASRLLKQRPGDVEASFLIGLCEEQMGHLPVALEWYRKSIQSNPDNRDLKLKLASLLVRTGAQSEAEEIYLECIKADKEDTAALSALADLYHFKGDLASEFVYLRGLKQQDALTKSTRDRIIDCLAQEQFTLDYPGLEDDLCDFLDYTDVDLRRISSVVSRCLEKRFGLTEEDKNLELSDLLQDKLFTKALTSVQFTTPKTEELITTIRSALFNDIVAQQTIPQQLVPFIGAIAMHNYLNEYVHYISEQEREILGVLTQLLETQAKDDNWTPAQSELILLMLAMYGQLYDLPQKDLLLSHPIEEWPESLTDIAKATLFGIDQEIKAAEQIPSLTPVEDETSKAVRAQYESNPYPRWDRVPHFRAGAYGDYMASKLPNYAPPKGLQQKSFSTLIAGCGTGKQPIQFALIFPGSRIMAVDISRRSLAYAQQKAEEYEVDNISFFHGDILKLDQLKERFDVIQCGGVLHHLADPLEGWAVLRDLLVPNGVMQIDLYSQIARQDVTRQREMIAQLKMESTADNIRRYRQALMTREPDTTVVRSYDFYTLSMCRDLLFHCQEHQFTWPQIQESCDQLGLEFIGLNAKQSVYNIYKNAFPDDKECRDLDNWHQLELHYPRTFGGMYSFWCKRKNTVTKIKK